MAFQSWREKNQINQKEVDKVKSTSFVSWRERQQGREVETPQGMSPFYLQTGKFEVPSYGQLAKPATKIIEPQELPKPKRKLINFNPIEGFRQGREDFSKLTGGMAAGIASIVTSPLLLTTGDIDKYKKSIRETYKLGKGFGEFALGGGELPQDIIDQTINTPVGQVVVTSIARETNDLPLKAGAIFATLGSDKTSKEIYSKWRQANQDPDNPAWQKFLYGLQGSGTQTLIGVGISTTIAILTKNPAAASLASGGFWTALSASEQIKKEGRVYSPGNLAIDVALDSVLGNSIKGIFRKPIKVIQATILTAIKNFSKKFGKGFVVEGGTEVTQSLLKLSNDYKNAKTLEGKSKAVEEAKQYFISGDILMELGIGGIAGGIISGGATISTTKQAKLEEPRPITPQKVEMPDMKVITDPSELSIPIEKPLAEQEGVKPIELEQMPAQAMVDAKAIEPPTDVVAKDKLVNELLAWSRADVGEKVPDFSPKTIELLSKYKPTETVTLYKGIETGKKLDESRASSWTYDRDVAEMHTRDDGKVIEREFTPEQILVDTTEMPGPLFRKSGFIMDEEEVIIKGVEKVDTLTQEATKFKTAEELYKFQNSNQEKIISSSWKGGNSYRYDLEGSGDMFRELTKDVPDITYINEKIRRVDNLLTSIESGKLHIDDTLATAKKSEPNKINDLLDFWKKQPTITEQQKIVKDLNIALLEGEYKTARELLNQTKSQLTDIFNKAQEKPKKKVIKKKVVEADKPIIKKVPKEQLPIKAKEGKVKASKLEQRVEQVIGDMTQDSIDELGLTAYNQMNKKENIRKATEYVVNNEEEAMDVLLGKRQAPKGLLRNSIFIAMQEKASQDINKELALKIATLESTRYGQEISILSEVNKFSSVGALDKLVKIYEKTFAKRTGKELPKVKKRTVKEIKEKIKKPSKYDFENFINEITCK